MDLKLDESKIPEEVLAILIFGSCVENERLARDIDICVVAPKAENKASLLLKMLSMLSTPKTDIWLFEELPLYMKAEVIQKHKILWCKNIKELYLYFAETMKLWRDQKTRRDKFLKQLLKSQKDTKER